MDLEEIFGVKYQDKETQMMYHNWTLGQFVNETLRN
jgi:hypothetical protein